MQCRPCHRGKVKPLPTVQAVRPGAGGVRCCKALAGGGLKPRRRLVDNESSDPSTAMNTIEPLLQAPAFGPRGRRQHRFMESADIRAAFGAVFLPLRSNIRRGLSIRGQLYGLETDPCIPGELLGACWLPPASLGIGAPTELADPARRRPLLTRLLDEPRQESLLAYVCEGCGSGGEPVLYVELASADGFYGAEHPILPGSGWHVRELGPALPRRLAADGR